MSSAWSSTTTEASNFDKNRWAVARAGGPVRSAAALVGSGAGPARHAQVIPPQVQVGRLSWPPRGTPGAAEIWQQISELAGTLADTASGQRALFTSLGTTLRRPLPNHQCVRDHYAALEQVNRSSCSNGRYTATTVLSLTV